MTTFPLHRILAAVDLSSCSRAALEFACRMSVPTSAHIEVLLVTEGPADESSARATAEELHRFIASVPATRTASITERVERGNPEELIVSLAAGGNFDAIVLGTHGRTGRARALAGSVAESVVRNARCPVITVRE